MQPTLPRRASAPAIMNLRKSTLVIVFGMLIFLSVLVTYIVTSWKTTPTAPPLPEITPIPAESMEKLIHKDLPPTYGEVKRPTPVPFGVALPSISLPQPAVAQAAVPPPPEPRPPINIPPVQMMPPPVQPQAPIIPPSTQPTPDKGEKNVPDSKKWLVAKPVDIRFERKSTQQTTPKPTENTQVAQAQALIPPANWVKPRRPELVLYRDQFIPGILLDGLNSDIPGQVRIMVTRDVLDRFQSGTVLVPQFSHVIGQQEGKAQTGQTRLDITADQIIFPDGTVIELVKTKLADATGATGLEANVNNHYGKLILAAGISAILNIGVREAAGSPQGFQQNTQQEAARDIGQSVQRDAQRTTDRLRVDPTLTAKAGTEITLHLSQNVSFQKPYKITTK